MVGNDIQRTSTSEQILGALLGAYIHKRVFAAKHAWNTSEAIMQHLERHFHLSQHDLDIQMKDSLRKLSLHELCSIH